ncbi:MAG: sigma-70 family RNA polymerase sigma factor [Muribaculaceae bacterium]|nr:sigma-70 family RNA polymerase sigma factor [Muribaculaceae bacterium]
MRLTDAEKRNIFEQCIAQYSTLINKICYMYAADMDNFNDLRQEVLINVWQGLAGFEECSKLSTWIYRVSINTCISYTQKEHKHSSHSELTDNIYCYDESEEHLQQLQEMYKLIDQLNRLDKALILLWLDEMPYEEIGAIMGINRNNVASRLRRAKEKLTNMANS